MVKRLFIGTKVKIKDFDAVKRKIEGLGIWGKWVEEENLHFTYRFLGNFEEEKLPSLFSLLKGKLRSCSAVKVEYKGLGYFERSGIPRILFVKVVSQDLERVKWAVDQALLPFGFPLEEKFTPHVTLLRIKRFRRRAKFKSYIKSMEEHTFGESLETKVTVFESKLTPKGPIYTSLEEIEIG